MKFTNKMRHLNNFLDNIIIVSITKDIEFLFKMDEIFKCCTELHFYSEIFKKNIWYIFLLLNHRIKIASFLVITVMC